jgi:hypothetical protein
VAGLFWEKSTVSWWLINQENRVQMRSLPSTWWFYRWSTARSRVRLHDGTKIAGTAVASRGGSRSGACTVGAPLDDVHHHDPLLQ